MLLKWREYLIADTTRDVFKTRMDNGVSSFTDWKNRNHVVVGVEEDGLELRARPFPSDDHHGTIRSHLRQVRSGSEKDQSRAGQMATLHIQTVD